MRPNRIPPNLPVQAYRTFSISAPLSTHYRPATCAEVDCANHANGFRIDVDENTDLGQQQAHYIRHDRTRKHAEARTPEGLTSFTFPPETRCFAQHHEPLGRPEFFTVRAGDHRGNPTGERPRQHTRPEHWIEEFNENQDALQTRIDRG